MPKQRASLLEQAFAKSESKAKLLIATLGLAFMEQDWLRALSLGSTAKSEGKGAYLAKLTNASNFRSWCANNKVHVHFMVFCPRCCSCFLASCVHVCASISRMLYFVSVLFRLFLTGWDFVCGEGVRLLDFRMLTSELHGVDGPYVRVCGEM